MLRSSLNALFWLAAVVCVTAQLFVVRDVVAGRAPGRSRAPSARWKEIAWVVIPALGLLAVLLATWHALGGRVSGAGMSTLT